ncbi:transmembrane protein, putative [Bodo saltans]|uniref:Transmembrane protein, putative n=1 Tax=Bodo saltans TaxID=75058 RepID=A0A0S4JQA6_BODSA|nr:transmembrane protein, putative [Bodo saltans]|eukprot:CUG92691.1 transmembrane protein, putative [Bodo saltans]
MCMKCIRVYSIRELMTVNVCTIILSTFLCVRQKAGMTRRLRKREDLLFVLRGSPLLPICSSSNSYIVVVRREVGRFYLLPPFLCDGLFFSFSSLFCTAFDVAQRPPFTATSFPPHL